MTQPIVIIFRQSIDKDSKIKIKTGVIMFYMKRKPLPLFDLCAIRRFEKGEHHITRVYQKSVIIFMLEGVLRFEENGKEISLREGEYYIQRAGLFQSGLRPSDSPVYFFIHIDAEFSTDPNDGIPIRGKFSKEAITAYADEYERLFRTHETTFFLMNSIMLQIFSELESTAAPENARVRIAKDIKRYIASEFAGTLSLSKIAERYGYSDDYIIKIFKNRYGITPYQYLIKKRLAQAESLLVQSNLSIEEISRAVGYNDFSTFFRDFKKKYGMSPTERRTLQENDEQITPQ